MDIKGSAKLAVQAAATLNLDLGLDLSDPANPKPFLYDTTGMSVSAKASAANLSFTAAVGPLGLYITNGSVVLDKNATDPNDNGDPVLFTVKLVNDGTDRTYFSNLGSLTSSNVQVSLTGQVNATLPIYFPTSSDLLGPLQLTITDLSNIPLP